MALTVSVDRQAAVRIALGALGFRLVSAAVALFASLAFPVDRPQQATMFGSPSPFWDQFTRYDSGWYYQIARYGYWFVPGGPSAGIDKPGKIAYFPLYPLLMRYAGRWFGSSAADVYLGGIAVSWVAFALALALLFSLARLDLERDAADRAVLLTAIFPFSFFFGLVYTESLFLLLTVAAFYAFRTRRWIVGGVAAGLATATRVNGVLLLPALAWIAWTTAGDSKRDRALAAVGLLLSVSGITAYSAYVYHLSGRPFEWASSDRKSVV
jgi:Gpi18-like mannosyltransferase